MKTLFILFFAFMTISCELETEAEKIDRLETLEADKLTKLKDSKEVYEKLSVSQLDIAYSFESEKVLREYSESGRSFVKKRFERTSFIEESKEVLSRSFLRSEKTYEVSNLNGEKREDEVLQDRIVLDEFSENAFSGSLGSHSSGIKVIGLNEIYEGCKSIIEKYSKIEKYTVKLDLDFKGLLKNCYAKRKSSTLDQKFGYFGLSIDLD